MTIKIDHDNIIDYLYFNMNKRNFNVCLVNIVIFTHYYTVVILVHADCIFIVYVIMYTNVGSH